ncbi:MAG: stage 0 sporulation family protein [Actinomycetes bacterium]|jgi:cell fate regulator YaaT (PSP1 superfamily)|nr:stage 0 sporulation family protein [Actinomycetes bacterium]
MTPEIQPDTTAEQVQSSDSPENVTATPMVEVVGVRFRYSKTLWFDPDGYEPKLGDTVIVSTDRGTEAGECVLEVWEVPESDLAAPLKPVKRIANERDRERLERLAAREREAMPTFRAQIEAFALDMKPVDVEILFGEEKMVFYFAAEERVDFRALVRELAGIFHSRIDMRQVGVRDEARMVGGIGHCGEMLCCARMGGEFNPVSIRMAKDQGLPLNPTKISGLCGRLMCCLRYEVEAYKDFNRRAPRKGLAVDTPRGEGKVIELDALREQVTLQFAGDVHADSPMGLPASDKLKVDLCRLHCEQGCKKCSLNADDLDDIEQELLVARNSTLSALGLGFGSLTSTQGTAAAIDNGESSGQRPGQSGARSGRGGRGGSGGGEASGEQRKRRRGRGRGKSSGERQAAQAGPAGGDNAAGSGARTAPSGQTGGGRSGSSNSSGRGQNRKPRQRQRNAAQSRGNTGGATGGTGGSNGRHRRGQGGGQAQGQASSSAPTPPFGQRIPRRRNRSE